MNPQTFLEISISNYQSDIHLLKLTGTETLFAPFHFELTLMPESAEDFNQLKLANEVSFAIHHQTQQTPQWFNGIIETIQYADRNLKNTQTTKLSIVPKLNLMQNVQRSRSFTNVTTKAILKQLCQDYQIFDIDFSQLSGADAELPYCVQYQETDLQFLERLCSSQGIYYYFQHSKVKHLLIFSDYPLPAFVYPDLLIHRNVHNGETAYLYHWIRSQKSFVPTMQSLSFNMLNPNHPDQASNQTKQAQTKIPIGDVKYIQHDEAGFLNNPAELAARVKIQHEAELLQQQSIHCEGNYPYLSAGMQLNIASEIDPQINGAYYIDQIQHTANAETGEILPEYKNALSLNPQSLFFVPPIVKHASTIPGVISAVVTGSQNSEAYSNNFAEIKVQPEWGGMSNWVRVKQMFVGNGYGSQFIPRIGQAVILSHQQGQSHKPSVIGSVFTTTQLPIYKPSSQSGFKTHSLGSEINHGHQLLLDDTPEQEQLLLKSQKDKEVVVQGTHQRSVGNNSHKHLEAGDYQLTAQGECILDAKQKLHLQVGTSEIILDKDGTHFHADNINIST